MYELELNKWYKDWLKMSKKKSIIYVIMTRNLAIRRWIFRLSVCLLKGLTSSKQVLFDGYKTSKWKREIIFFFFFRCNVDFILNLETEVCEWHSAGSWLFACYTAWPFFSFFIFFIFIALLFFKSPIETNKMLCYLASGGSVGGDPHAVD